LAPTHVVVNVDENLKEDAEALAEFRPERRRHPSPGAARQPRPLPPARETFGRKEEAERLCARFERAYERSEAAAETREERDVLYLIWRDPWMSVARETYISQTLALFDWHTRPVAASERYRRSISPPMETSITSC